MALVLLLALSGCGGKTGTVTGKVTLNGEPVKQGNVVFTPDTSGKRPVNADLKPDGTFKMEKVPVGPGKFSVETSMVRTLQDQLNQLQNAGNFGGGATNDQQAKVMEDQRKNREAQIKDLEERLKGAVMVPTKYNDPKQAGLSYEVKQGSQEHNLPLEGQFEVPGMPRGGMPQGMVPPGGGR